MGLRVRLCEPECDCVLCMRLCLCSLIGGSKSIMHLNGGLRTFYLCVPADGCLNACESSVAVSIRVGSI